MIFQDRLVDADYAGNPELLGSSQTAIVFSPSQSFDFPFDQYLTDSEALQFIAKKGVLLVYGAVLYTDAFNNPRSTEFCFEFVYFDIQGRPCKRHNEAS